MTGNAQALFDRVDLRIGAASIDTRVEARDEDFRSERFFDVGTRCKCDRLVDRSCGDNGQMT